MGVSVWYRWQQGEGSGPDATPVAQADIFAVRNDGPSWVHRWRIIFEAPPPSGLVMMTDPDPDVPPGAISAHTVGDRWHLSSPGEVVVVVVEWWDEESNHHAQRWEFVRRENPPQGDFTPAGEPQGDGTRPVVESVLSPDEQRAGKNHPFEIQELDPIFDFVDPSDDDW